MKYGKTLRATNISFGKIKYDNHNEVDHLNIRAVGKGSKTSPDSSHMGWPAGSDAR